MSEGTANSLTVRIAIGLYCLVGAGFLGQDRVPVLSSVAC